MLVKAKFEMEGVRTNPKNPKLPKPQIEAHSSLGHYFVAEVA